MPSYAAAKVHGKPVVIAEFGCIGDKDYVLRCTDFSPANLKLFPSLKGIVFYNRIDTGKWPDKYGRPDWRITESSLAFLRAQQFLSVKSRSK